MPTTRTFKLAPSILSADFARLGDEVAAVAPFSDVIHIDVMDGHFVPPITIGPVVVRALRRVTDLPLECHLMVAEPERQIEQFAEAGASAVVWHLEAADDPRPVLKRARGVGLIAGLAVNPPTPFAEVREFLPEVDTLICMTVNPGWAGQEFLPEVLPKIREAREFAEAHGLALGIAVDGGVNLDTGRRSLEAGATVLGAASSIYSAPDPAGAAKALRDLLDEWASQ